MLNEACFLEDNSDQTFSKRFSKFKNLKIRPWSFNPVIKEHNILKNYSNIIKETFIYPIFAEKIEEKKESASIFYELRENFRIREQIIWKSNEETIFEKIMNRHLLYDEYDYLGFVIGSFILKKKFYMIRSLLQRL